MKIYDVDHIGREEVEQIRAELTTRIAKISKNFSKIVFGLSILFLINVAISCAMIFLMIN